MKIRALIGVWLVALMGLAMCGASLPDIGLSSNRGKMAVGLKTSLANGGGVAKIDTVRVLSRVTAFPNTAAAAADYFNTPDTTGVVNQANDGTTVRWGWVTKTAPTTVQASTSANSDYANSTRPHSTDKDHTANANQRFFFIWFSANGLTNGDKIESAYIMANVINGWTLSGSAMLSARLDTLTSDYSILNGSTSGFYGSNNDAGRFDCTWDNTSQRLGTPWVPDLDDRDDYHDFGPKSATNYTAATYTVGQSLRWDVTDAVQQASDSGTLGRGLLFLIYGTGTTAEASKDFCAGNSVFAGASSGKGCPVFMATSSSRRGVRPWGGVKVPIAFMWDDAYDAQVGYYRALRTAGETFTAATSGYGMAAHDWPDSLLALGRTDFRIVAHSKFHESMGRVSADSLTQDLARKWMLPYFPSGIDTTAIVDYAWPGNDRRPVRGFGAISAMIDNGYRSARSGGFWWTAGETATHHDTRLSWNGYVNRYLLWSYNAKDLFAVAGAPATEAQVADQLGDMIDDSYTLYGRAPVIIYGHSYDELDVNEFTSEAMLTYVAGLDATWQNVQIMDYGDVVGLRLSGATYLAPGDISEWTSAGVYAPVMRGIGADSNMIQAMAAQQDSVYEASSDANLLQMWIGPK